MSLTKQIRGVVKADAKYLKLIGDIEERVVCQCWVKDGLLHAKGGKLFVPKDGKLRLNLMKEDHNTRWVGHPGKERMKALLSKHYYWPNMESNIEAYVKSCYVCQQDKPGLLQPLPVPDRPWASISMYFIFVFLKVNDMSSMMVVVDQVTKYVIFILTPATCLAEKAATFFLRHVVKHFSVPQHIVSDHDARFIGKFWTALFCLLGMELKFSTANHPRPMDRLSTSMPCLKSTSVIMY